MSESIESIESIVKELVGLHIRPKIRKQDIPRAKQLLIELKRRGYSPEQIEEMTQGKWKASTVKYYTKGVYATESSEPRESLSTIAEMAAEGMNLDEVRQANSVKRILEAHRVSVEQLTSTIEQVGYSGVSLTSLVATVEEAAKHGLPISELGDIIRYKKSLGEMGIDDVRKLGRLYEMISKQGARDFDRTIEFIRKFDEAGVLQSEINRLAASKKELEEKADSMQLKIAAMSEKEKAIQSWLDLYRVLKEKGFTENVLAKLQKVLINMVMGLAPCCLH